MNLDGAVEAGRDALLKLVAALVAAPSVNPPGDVRAAADVLVRWLAGQGIAAEVVGPAAEKPNIVAHIDGTAAGRGAIGHLVFNGHLDTIPPGDARLWTVPLFEARRAGGRITGLGVGNMKAGTAALAFATALLAGHRHLFAGRLTLTAVGDEITFGPDGAGWLIEHRPDVLGEALLCGEGPGEMGLAIAEKGLLWLEIEARVRPAQGMLSTRGSSAVARLADVLVTLDGWNERRAEPPAGAAVLAEHAGSHGLRLSVNCGLLEAPGLASQVAPRARAHVDLRVPPGLSVDDMEAEVRAVASRREGVEVHRIKGWDPSFTVPDTPLAAAVAEAFLAVRGMPARAVVRLPASDAARWRRRGVPAVCFGPQPTFVAGIDDYAEDEDVIDCAKIYARTALALLSPGQTAE